MVAWWVSLVMLGAAEPTPVAITWTAPEECPLRQRFEAELHARTPKVRVVAADEKPGATLDVRITRVGQRYVGVSKLRVGFGGLTVRELKGARCETLIGALSLTVALLIDPDGANTGAVTVQDPPPEPVVAVVDPPRVVEPPRVEPPRVEPLRTDPSRTDPPRTDPPPVDPPRTDPPRVVETPPVVSAPEAPTSRARVELLAHGGLTSAPRGAVEPEVGLRGVVDGRLLRLQVTALFAPGQTFLSPVGAVNYRTFGGRLDLLAQLRPREWLALGAGPQVSVLVISALATTAEEPVSHFKFLLAPGLVAQARLNLGMWRVALEGGAGVHLLRGRFLVEGAGTAFTSPVVFAQLGLSAGLVLP